jgi:hypothetical protein
VGLVFVDTTGELRVAVAVDMELVSFLADVYVGSIGNKPSYPLIKRYPLGPPYVPLLPVL